MAGIWPVIQQGGPWFALLFVVLAGVTALAFALSRGILVRGAEVERIERRIEKDTDRVLALYVKQIDQLTEAGLLKDATIQKQAEQIEKFRESTHVATEALDKIVREAERRGIFPAE